MKLSVIVPCYNEIHTIEIILKKIRDLNFDNLEIILVDDCSIDGTREKLKNEIENHSLVDKIFYHNSNLGKGAAIRTGVKVASGDIIIIQDADLEYDPSDYNKLISPILSNKADVVYGSRFYNNNVPGSKLKDENKVFYSVYSFGNTILTFFSNLFTNIKVSDMETGYKVFKANIIKNIEIEENRFGFEPEITAKISKLKCRICEVGISYYGRAYQEGKKITWKDGIKAFYYIIKYNIFR